VGAAQAAQEKEVTVRQTVRMAAAIGVVTLLAAACGSSKTPSSGGSPSSSSSGAAAATFKACMVTDTGGIDDRRIHSGRGRRR
jgi:basic membrane protein A